MEIDADFHYAEEEYFFTCPYCWQQISMMLDPSISQQKYIEDCEVCCNPIEISYTIQEGQIVQFEAVNIEQ
ncbi:MAG: CPXCG motif-containing cysteine-rich protein [Bacteroidota bacterium]